MPDAHARRVNPLLRKDAPLRLAHLIQRLRMRRDRNARLIRRPSRRPQNHHLSVRQLKIVIRDLDHPRLDPRPLNAFRRSPARTPPPSDPDA